ncbi:MAG: HAD family hydrolase [Bacteroidetes bacterium]|nr:HAD family hydrolase [Bacteroidota bacterium]
MNNINTIIWDWNGTLLNDVDVCIDAINILLQKRNIEQITKTLYKEIFTFPVIDYYKKVGFDFNKDSFDILAVEFIDIYREKLKSCNLFDDVKPILQKFNNNNYQQIILSAMQETDLTQSVIERGIKNYFQHILGINNHFANNKIGIALDYINKSNLQAGQACLIGDTIHDYEVAQKIGCKCILVDRGHQSRDRLLKTNVPVVKNLIEAESWLKDFK